MQNHNEYDFTGFGLKGIGCFANEMAYMGPFEKIHLITGKNNSGKTTLAEFAARLLPCANPPMDWQRPFTQNISVNYLMHPEDKPRSWVSGSQDKQRVALCFDVNRLLYGITSKWFPEECCHEALATLLNHPAFSVGQKGFCWFTFDITNEASRIGYSLRPVIPEIENEGLSSIKEAINTLSKSLTNERLDFEVAYARVINTLVPWEQIPDVIRIAAIRKATSERQNDPGVKYTTASKTVSGEGLIDDLLHLSNPLANQRDKEEQWAFFNRLVRDMLGDNSAMIRIDADKTSIQVQLNDEGYYPLESLGTGIEELVIMAAIIACNKGKLIVIEEPEIHLHPSMQARFMKALVNDPNDNRFLITTHSPTIINAEGVSITQVTKINGVSHARLVSGAIEARDALHDLGVRPSDILQANYVIWVEGPSDRIYLNHWIQAIDPDLHEGLDYAVMIYGGKLLSACSADPEAQIGNLEDLIKLFNINTHYCVLMDSDKTCKDGKISKTKQRIIQECDNAKCLAWVTEGRTIENYVPKDILARAISKVHPGKSFNNPLDDDYICPLSFTFEGTQVHPDKIRIARYVATQSYELPESLRCKIGDLIKDIKNAGEREL